MTTIKKKLIVVADDMGWTDGVNEAIIDAYLKGIVTEVSLMIDAPKTERAIELLNKHKIKNVGIHLGLIGWSIHKKFLNRQDYIKLFKYKTENEIKNLALDELDKFTKLTGHLPTHIIPQYGIHGNLKLLKPLIEYAKSNKIPMRIPQTALSGGAQPMGNFAAEKEIERARIRTTNYLFSHVIGSEYFETKQAFLQDLMTVSQGLTAEILFHPGFFDEDLIKLTSLQYERCRDYAISMDKDFVKQIKKLGFKFISYSEL